MAFFFNLGDLLTGLSNHQVGILLGELLVLGIARQGGLHSRNIVGRNMPGVVLAILPALESVVRAGGAGALQRIGRELAALHGRNGGNLPQNLMFIGLVHRVASMLATLTANIKLSFPRQKNFVSHPPPHSRTRHP